jgi:hypothetical protein
MGPLRRFTLWIICVSSCISGARATGCPRDDLAYNGYRVKSVRIASPFAFFNAATSGFDDLKKRLPLQEGAPFSQHVMGLGVPLIRESVQAGGAASNQKLKVVVVTAHTEDCDDEVHTLNVLYWAFTNIFSPEFSHTFEGRTAEVQRPSTTGAQLGTAGRYSVKPVFGYDAARHGYGGLDLVSDVPFGPWQHIDFHSSLSSNSKLISADASGAFDTRYAGLKHAESRFGYHYQELPAGSAILKESKLVAQFLASTRELREGGLSLRYGAALEGGHQQSSGAPPGGVPPNSSFGALRFYFGGTQRFGQHALTASYGGELGTTLTNRLLDFDKHVVDIGYTRRFLKVPKGDDLTPPGGTVHKPWDLELRATGGFINDRGRLPAAERIFGGNQVQPLLAGDSWVIPANALIRSIPQNKLAGLDNSGAFGGTRFYSGNLTLAKALWGRPMLPKGLATDPSFIPELRAAILTAKGTLEDRYKAGDPAYQAALKELAGQLNSIDNPVQQLTAALRQLTPSALAQPSVAAAVRAIKGRIPIITSMLKSARAGKSTAVTSLVNFQLPHAVTEIENLAKLLATTGQSVPAEIPGLGPSIEAATNTLKADLAKVNSQSVKDAAREYAKKEFSVPQKVLNAFLYELNTFSIAPVGIFDVARVWPSDKGIRFAAGGGARFSLVNLNLTVGYAFNPNRGPNEGIGAALIKLDLTDLFR